jgi:hypothetical protein
LLVALAFLAALAWLGISGGVHVISSTATTGQLVQGYAQLVYGLLCLGVCITTFWFTNLAVLLRVGWLVAITIAAGLAPIVWGGSGVLIGGVSALAAILVGWGCLALLRFGGRS